MKGKNIFIEFASTIRRKKIKENSGGVQPNNNPQADDVEMKTTN